MNPEAAKRIIKAIKELAKKDGGFSLNELRTIMALERATARLTVSETLSQHLIFKGGFVLLKIHESRRFTRDADALAVAIPKEELKDAIAEALTKDLEDGFWFGDLSVRELTEQGEYGAYRFDFAYCIGHPDPKKVKNLSRIHIDIGFSDKLDRKPSVQSMPSLLDEQEAVSWRVYPPEFIVAEKVQTIIERGSTNSRAKDVYDLNYLFPRCKDAKAVLKAIRETFKNRKTEIPTSLEAHAKKIDTEIMSRSWASVEIEGKSDFRTAWKELLNNFEKLDRLLAKE